MSSLPNIARALVTLRGILEREKARGLETLAISPESESALRELPKRLWEGRKKEENPPRKAMEPIGSWGRAHAVAETVSEDRLEGREKSSPPQAVPLSSSPPPEPVPAPPVRPPSPDLASAPLDEAERRRRLNAIFKQVKAAPEPRALGTLHDTVVFAYGNPMADIVFVGEAPGSAEEDERKPFVGPAGQKLDQIIKAMGLRRESVYITNIVKFRPKIGDGRFQGTRNRPPYQQEMAACLPYIRAEIEVVRPRVIVALGRTAAEGLLERGGSIASFRNHTHEFLGIPVVVTYHPSYVLRQEGSSAEAGRLEKRLVWEDMLRVMELAGLPISEKQRRYFQ